MPDDDRMVRKIELRALTGLSEPTIRREEGAGRFPRRIKLARRAVGWRFTEIAEWLAKQRESPGDGR